MSNVLTEQSGGRPVPTPFGLGRAALEAMIVTALEEAGDDLEPRALAIAVATAIEANNQELLRQLNRTLASDRTSSRLPDVP